MYSNNLTQKWRVSNEVLSGKIDDEFILMSIEADSYFGIDLVGSQIWEILSKQAATINDLVKILVEDYEVDDETCKKGVEIFINELYEKKLIIAVD